MADMANLVAYDGATTPVQRTFYPVSSDVDKDGTLSSAIWREQLANTPNNGQGTVKMSIQKIVKTGVYRVSIRTEIPVMEIPASGSYSGLTAAPTVAHILTNDHVSYFHPRSTIEERRLSRMIGVNLLNNITASVAAATAGAGPLTIDTLVSPT